MLNRCQICKEAKHKWNMVHDTVCAECWLMYVVSGEKEVKIVQDRIKYAVKRSNGKWIYKLISVA